LKIVMLAIGSVACLSVSVAQISSSIKIANQASTKAGISQYLVYKHFLSWVSSLDKQATAAGATDPYKFAEPFASHAGLTHADVDALRNEAHALDTALNAQDAKAYATIAAFREKAKSAAGAGNALPPSSSEISQLERERTALLVQHYVTLRTALGLDTMSRLDAYLTREFTPHLSINPVSRSPLPKTSTGQANGFTGTIR